MVAPVPFGRRSGLDPATKQSCPKAGALLGGPSRDPRRADDGDTPPKREPRGVEPERRCGGRG